MNSPFLRYTAKMSLDVGGYENRPDWPKLGPSFLIATCLIVAIRTAKWAAMSDARISGSALDQEIDFAAHVADRVLARLMRANEVMFPQKKEPWYQPDDEDHPK
jgi:hypothetical protein